MYNTLTLTNKMIEDSLQHPYGAKERAFAIKLGMAHAAASHGLEPEDMESIIKLAGVGETAGAVAGGLASGLSMQDSINFLAKEAPLAMIGLGIAGGIGSAHLRYNVEKELDGTDDPEMNVLRKKLEGYKRLRKDIEDERAYDRAATPA